MARETQVRSLRRITLPSDSLLGGGFNEVYALNWRDLSGENSLTKAYTFNTGKGTLFDVVLFVDRAFTTESGSTITSLKVTFSAKGSGVATSLIDAKEIYPGATGAAKIHSSDSKKDLDADDKSDGSGSNVITITVTAVGANLSSINDGVLRILTRAAYQGDLFNDSTPIQSV